MDTFTLVVSLWLLDASWDTPGTARTPGLGWEECRAAAKLVARPQGSAWCEADRQGPETFDLFVSIPHGRNWWQVEERYIPDLSEADCETRSEEIRKDGARGVRTMCV